MDIRSKTDDNFMLAAQLCCKLTRREEDLEDLLTSNVFGSIKYVPHEDGLIPLLSAAEKLDGSNPFKKLSEISEVDYKFWPYLEEQADNGCEPDVIINIMHTNGVQTTILVEAKYKSGKSSEANDTDRGDKPNDQLAREWDNLIALAKRRKSKPFLMYVTADIGYPKNDIEASRSDYFRIRGDNIDIVWLSWRKLSAIFHDSRCGILKDLLKVLRKQGLTFFEGFALDHIEAFKWQFQIASVRHIQPTSLKQNWSFNVPEIKWKYNSKALIQFDWAIIKFLKMNWRFTK